MNRCAGYLAALEVETFQVLAIGENVTELCRTHSYFDAACEADEMARGVLPMPVEAEYLVVLSPQGKQCGPRFPTQRAVAAMVRTETPASVSLVMAVWFAVAVATVGLVFWLGSQ